MRAMGAIFVLSVALGALFGAMYDVLRILRLMRPEKKDKKTKSKASNNVSGEKTNKSKEHMSSGKIKIRIAMVIYFNVLLFIGFYTYFLENCPYFGYTMITVQPCKSICAVCIGTLACKVPCGSCRERVDFL